MASSFNPSSYYQVNQYDKNTPAIRSYGGSNNVNNITPISHQLNASPPKQYGGYGGALNILSPQSTYKQYQFGEFQSGVGQKDIYPTTSSFISNNAYSYNKPFAPPSSQNGPVNQYLGSNKYVGGSAEGQFNQFQGNTGPKQFNDLDFELNKLNAPNKFSTSNNPIGSLNQKKYAFEQSPKRSNYFDVDKYFENFKDPLENFDVNAKTLPKSYTADKSAPVYSNSTTLNQANQILSYQAQPIPQVISVNKYSQDPAVQQTTFSGPMYNKDKFDERPEVQSRVILDQKSDVPAFTQHVGESIYVKRDKNRSLVDFQIKNPSYNQPEVNYENVNKSTSYLPQPSFNFSIENNQVKQANRYDQVLEKPQQSPVNFDLTLPFAEVKKQDTKKQQQQQEQQSQQQQNFFKEYNEQKKQRTEPTPTDDPPLFKSKEYYDLFISHQRQQKEIGFQQYQQNLQEQVFKKQLKQYLKQQSPQKNNILEKLEQKNNKQDSINHYKSKQVAMIEKIRSKVQSQNFLNKITTELDAEQVYFIKFLVEQIAIDSEIDKVKDEILKSTEFSIQIMFNFFDKKKKRSIDINSFLEGLENLSIPYIKIYVQKIFFRYLQDDNKQLRYCDFAEIFAQNKKQGTMINQIFSFVGPKNGVIKEQKKSFQFIKNLSSNINEEQKKLIQQLFTHLVNIEKSIQSFKDMQGDEEILFKIFRSLDKSQKGFLVINDFVDYLNQKGGDYEKEEFIGIFKRLSFTANSSRINFHEFLTQLQRDVIVQPAPEQQKAVVQHQKEEELKPIKILKEPNMPGFKKVQFKGKRKNQQQ
ncbi:hypothetical protein ABPG72_004060 [Tetrahymena utriculariae]